MAVTGSSPPAEPFANAQEVPLRDAPIVRVLAQARFAGSVARINDAAAQQLSDALGDWLPFINPTRGVELLIGPNGVQQQAGQTAQWEYHDGGQRRITLTSSWISYDLGPYDSRTAFAADLDRIFTVLHRITGPVPVARLGVRYINQIDDAESILRLSRLVRREILGPLATPSHEQTLVHTFTETLLRRGSEYLQVRNGLLPAGALIDPTVPPVPRPSWTLDLDAYSDQAPMLGPDLARRAVELATLAYNYFRWAITEEALQLFKGEQ